MRCFKGKTLKNTSFSGECPQKRRFLGKKTSKNLGFRLKPTLEPGQINKETRKFLKQGGSKMSEEQTTIKSLEEKTVAKNQKSFIDLTYEDICDSFDDLDEISDHLEGKAVAKNQKPFIDPYNGLTDLTHEEVEELKTTYSNEETLINKFGLTETVANIICQNGQPDLIARIVVVLPKVLQELFLYRVQQDHMNWTTDYLGYRSDDDEESSLNLHRFMYKFQLNRKEFLVSVIGDFYAWVTWNRMGLVKPPTYVQQFKLASKSILYPRSINKFSSLCDDYWEEMIRDMYDENVDEDFFSREARRSDLENGWRDDYLNCEFTAYFNHPYFTNRNQEIKYVDRQEIKWGIESLLNHEKEFKEFLAKGYYEDKEYFSGEFLNVFFSEGVGAKIAH